MHEEQTKPGRSRGTLARGAEKNLRRYSSDKSQANRKVVFWLPRVKDLPSSKGQAALDLDYLVSHAEEREYVVNRGDNLDKIIRSQLYVSATSQPRAYTIYFDYIKERNKLENPDLIYPKVPKMILPVGPHYAAWQSPIGQIDAYRFRADELLRKDKELTPDELNKRLYKAVGRFTLAFNLPMSRRRRKLAEDEIVANRILPAEYLDPKADREAVPIYDPRPLPLGLRAAGSNGLLREMESTYVDCKGHCDLCTSLLKAGEDPRPDMKAGW